METTITRANALMAANNGRSRERHDDKPHINDAATREDLIDWLCWADPNGAWSDADAHAEACDPMTREEAIEQIALMLTD